MCLYLAKNHQTDGMSIGSRFGPIFADSFMKETDADIFVVYR